MTADIFDVNKILKKYEYKDSSLIPILQEVQKLNEEKYISEEMAKYIAAEMKISKTRIYEVITFFSALNDKPKGKYFIQLCNSTVCEITDKDLIENALVSELGIQVGETSQDKMFTLEYTPCFGACDVSPAMRVNKVVYGNLTESKIKSIVSKLRGDTHE
ncbi:MULTISPECIES: complex I 24 kDa subunit family protein [Psychrilyobacter]|uniref:NAD(P)H-dependent oxidoreductase subunit E n=1 Tax=Psychrilyobacter piezotolerans TaxID=2293438 RepID=A0ABX9KIH5_9FUSO|nr:MULTISPECIES: NAD(P)H-dependent oxidoreductase subunit E [Psychrilyobacter]MCS5420637.1 NAD(P)H-dependent oxidoreductase subunit E [Psychrilyobacter sp. S5]NDI77344.1 NAD(P)H-dependent oxidoreductase subunit E [Psychrilyobacter piezotolerans]RDE63651.1 NAD(P)H-dependent oxidoreductase subunit E [Psychrilyobacter sp. S5]REI41995.1 NAD(P)H-dependent oxidoreductase subunit E [Psychrilyobacter piezotolerans]